MSEKWPFYELSSGAKLLENRFYAFSDAITVIGDLNGYTTAEECLEDLKLISPMIIRHGYYSFCPADLGYCRLCILNGSEYIGILEEICEGKELLNRYGHFIGE
jgi:hypothetical protein